MSDFFNIATEQLSDIINRFSFKVVKNGEKSLFLIGIGFSISLAITPYGLEAVYYYINNHQILYLNNLSLAMCARRGAWLSSDLPKVESVTFDDFVTKSLEAWKKLAINYSDILSGDISWIKEFVILGSPRIIANANELKEIRNNPPMKELYFQPASQNDDQILRPYFVGQGLL